MKFCTLYSHLTDEELVALVWNPGTAKLDPNHLIAEFTCRMADRIHRRGGTMMTLLPETLEAYFRGNDARE